MDTVTGIAFPSMIQRDIFNLTVSTPITPKTGLTMDYFLISISADSFLELPSHPVIITVY
jgi:hypothetical protein